MATQTSNVEFSVSAVTDEATFCNLGEQKFPHLTKMASFLNSFRVNDSFCDVTLTLQNRTYKAHKVVLASASAYFRAMFSSGYSESTTEEVTLEETPDLNGESFPTLLDFMYTGELRLSPATVPQVLASASYLQIKHATQACVDYINQAYKENKLSFEDFIRISSMTASYGINLLKEIANRYIATQFSELHKTQAFLQHMTYQNVSELLDRTDLLVASETEVFDAVISWLKHDWTNRNIHTISLLGKVRLGLVPIEDVIERFEGQLNELPECKDLYVNILKYYVLGKKQFVSKVLAGKEDALFTPRNSVKGLVAIGERSFIFDEDNNKMKELDKCVTHRLASHSVAVVNGELYCAGGSAGTEFMKYDNKKEKWISLPAMNSARSNFGFTHVQGYLYAIGGVKPCSPTAHIHTVECYDIANRNWQRIAPLFSSKQYTPIGFFPPVAKHKGRIFIGGYSSAERKYETARHYVLMFNPYSNKWYSLYSKLLDLNCHTLHVVVIDDTVYLIAFLKVSSRYNPGSTLWRWCPKVYKCECDVGSDGSEPSFSVGDTVDQTYIPETNMKVFRIGREVFIILRGYVYKTRVTISDDQLYDVNLDAYSALSSVNSNAYALTSLSFDKKYIKRETSTAL